MSFINIHTHTFTAKNAPERFLSLYAPDFLVDPIDTATNSTLGVKALASFISIWGAGGKRYASFLRIGKSKTQREIFENLMQQYTSDEMKFVALSMFMEEMGAGQSLSGFEGQLEELIQLKKMYPEKLLIFMGLDPRMANSGAALLNTVKSAFEQKFEAGGKLYSPFCGLKIYPSTGFYIFDEKLFPVLEWAAENGVPIMSHCSYLGGIFNNSKEDLESLLNPQIGYGYDQSYEQYCLSKNLTPPSYRKKKAFWKWIIGMNKQRNNQHTCSYFLEPTSFEPVLQYFENKGTPLKICLAHYGGESQIHINALGKRLDKFQEPPIGTNPVNWHQQINNMMSRFSSLYTDISYAIYDKDLHTVFLNQATDPVYGNRIMFGTDYYMTERNKNEKANYLEFRVNAIARKQHTGTGTLWEQMAKTAPADFLKSRFYP